MVLRVGGEERWVAAEDAGLYRDALGCVPPSGLPETFIADVPGRDGAPRAPLRAHARPVRVRARCASATALDLTPVLAGLERAGELVRGELRPGGTAREWCDPEVLRRLRRASLAALRKEIEPADQRALARFLPSWQGVDRHPAGGAGRRPPARGARPAAGPRAARPRCGSATCCRAASARTRPAWMDQLCAAGEVVWVGAGALGRRTGRVALYFREDAPVLGPPARRRGARRAGASPRTRRSASGSRPGACFFTDLLAEIHGVPSEELQDALWDLVWAGEVTNDAFAPLRSPKLDRARGRRSSGRARRRFSSRRTGTQPQVQGRWALTGRCSRPATDDPAARRRAQAELLLERYGIVTREQVLAEGIAGGFSSLYDSFAALETLGVARRGYFVEGLGGAQFALPGAVERLRAQRDDDAAPPLVLAATDPAQPYGGVLRWPKLVEGRTPARQAGAHVVLCGAEPVLYVERGGKGLQVLVPGEDERIRRRARGAGRRRAPRPHPPPGDRARRRRAGHRLALGGARWSSSASAPARAS